MQFVFEQEYVFYDELCKNETAIDECIADCTTPGRYNFGATSNNG